MSRSPELKTGECRVTWARVDASPGGKDLLSPAELGRLHALRRESDRLRFVAAHALLRRVVAGEVGASPQSVRIRNVCPTCGDGDHGQPQVIDDAGLHVSLTHAGDWAAAAVTRAGPLGVDLELVAAVAPLAAGEAGEVLSADERRWWAGLTQAERTTALAAQWTRKEALLKAAGTGLQTEPSTLSLSPPGTGLARLLTWAGRDPAPACTLVDLSPDPAYAGCVAVLTDQEVTVSGHEA